MVELMNAIVASAGPQREPTGSADWIEPAAH